MPKFFYNTDQIVELRGNFFGSKIEICTLLNYFKRVYAECSPLFQLIKLINSLRNYANDTILKKKIDEKSHSYNGFAFNVTRCFLDTYDPICRIENCCLQISIGHYNRRSFLDTYDPICRIEKCYVCKF